MSWLRELERALEQTIEGRTEGSHRLEVAHLLMRLMLDSRLVLKNKVEMAPNSFRIWCAEALSGDDQEWLRENLAREAAERGWVLAGPCEFFFEPGRELAAAASFALQGEPVVAMVDNCGAMRERGFVTPRGLVLGRGRGADLRLTDPRLSRRHARLYPAVGMLCLEDLGSRAGTRLEGARVGRVPSEVKDGNRIRVGDTELQVWLLP